MPYNLLLLPLCGGYFILLNFSYFKYRYQRLSSQRLLFSSVIAGVFLLFTTLLLRYFIGILFPYLIPVTADFLESHFPVRHIDYLWTSCFSFFLAILFTGLSNLIVKLFVESYKPISYAVKKSGDEIEKLFRISAITGELMQLTLKNNKVYIGFTDIIPVPKETNYLTITPVLSGYRNSETKELMITTDYFKVLEIYTTQNPDFEIYSIDISIKQDEILTASLYSQTVFDLFNKSERSEELPASDMLE